MKRFTLFPAFILLAATSFTLEGSPKRSQTKKILEQARSTQQRGRSLDAIAKYNRSIEAALNEEVETGILEGLRGRFFSWVDLYFVTKKSEYAFFAQQDAIAFAHAAQKHHYLAFKPTAHFMRGVACCLLERYSKAQEHIQKALEMVPQEIPEKGLWLTYLGYATFQNGQEKEGVNLINEGLHVIERKRRELPCPKYHALTGNGYLMLSELLLKYQPEEGFRYFQRAQKALSYANHKSVNFRRLENLGKNYSLLADLNSKRRFSN